MVAPRCLIIFVIFYPIVQNGNCDSVLESFFDSSANSTKNISNDAGTTTEIHYTTCKITTEQLVAEAQATFTRVLKGACNAKMIEERFEKLERSLNERLDEIRESIERSMTTRQDFDFSEANSDNDDDDGKVKTVFAKSYHRLSGNFVDNDEIKFDNGNKRKTVFSSSRHDEVESYNNTVHLEDEGRRKVYTYYWRVSNLYEKLLKWETGRSERSTSFYVIDAGYAMYLRFTPKYFPDGTIFISVGLTVGQNDGKITWPFPLQIRIEILDLMRSKNDRSNKDRRSRLWDPATVCSSYFWGRPRRGYTAAGRSDNPECVGLSIARQSLTNHDDDVDEQTISHSSSFSSSSSAALSRRNYISNDSMLIKLTVYL